MNAPVPSTPTPLAERNPAGSNYVDETRFGFWFLQSHVWQHHVLRVAINDLKGLLDQPLPANAVLLDAGCGQGKSFRLLSNAFAPQTLLGMDADPHSLTVSRAEAEREGLAVELFSSDAAAIQLPDASVDVLFCHQTFHHLVEQEKALAEFWRVLKPGGWLLFAESTKYYIDTWVIRWLFRHPMHVQRTAEEYLQMLREQGFEFGPQHVSYPYLWWSRSSDFGLLERWKLIKPKGFGQRNETLVNAAVRKPLVSAS